jgi:hypothetical protein
MRLMHRTRLLPAAAGLMLAATAGLAISSRSSAAVMGGARSRPYPEAVAKSRDAAQAVLDRSGTEHCLIGKLTNAMLGLSASCETAGERNGLCALADRAAATTRWTMDFTDETARQVLNLSGQPGG